MFEIPLHNYYVTIQSCRRELLCATAMNNHPVLLAQHILNFVALQSLLKPQILSFGYLASFSCPLFMKGNVYTSCEAMKAEDLRVYSYTC